MDRSLWQALSPFLDRALELEPGPRAGFLASVKSDNPTVAGALERMLAEHERVLASDFLESGPTETGTVPAILAEQTVGAYTLERPLGMGGMGTVWLARRSDGRFEGQVAVKLVNLSVLDAATMDRFAREGTFLARLSHPHIARLFDAGVTTTGQPYLVLEYVNGTRIDYYADSHRLDVRARIELFAQVAEAVAHAHANLVVHRDLKPSNILVDSAGQVKLLDFGIAKLIESDPPRDGALTAVTAPALTPRYAAPEQVSAGQITTATDVYALGVLLYELVSGCHPTARETDPVAQVRALVEREPPRLSEAVRTQATDPAASRTAAARGGSLDRLARACRGDLDTILAKALKKSPADRYAAVTAFAEDLRRYLSHEPVLARPDSLAYRARRFVVRHKLGLAAAASVFVSLIAGTAIAVEQARASARQRDHALAQLRRAEATDDFGWFLLSSARPSDKSISTAELLAQGEALIGKRFANDASLRVHMLLTLAYRYQQDAQWEARDRLLKRAYEDSRSSSVDAGLRSYATCAWASYFGERGEYPQAFALLDSVLPALSATPEYADFEAGCRVLESIAASQTSDAERAIRAGERALMLEDRRGGSSEALRDALSALATAYVKGSRYKDAGRTFARLAAAFESEGLENSVFAATSLGNWSSMLQETGQMVEAAAVGARAVRVARAADPENGAPPSALVTYGNALIAVGDYPEASKIIEEAIAKGRRAGSARRHIQNLTFAMLLAAESGDHDRGAQLVQEAYALLAADKSATAYSKGTVDAAAARVALARGDVSRAVTLAEAALATLETATPTKTGKQSALILFSRALNAAGRFGEAVTSAEQSVETVSRRLRDIEHSYQMGQALLEVATAKAGLGDSQAARATVAGALEHLKPTAGPKSPTVLRAEALSQRLGP
jgi:eukaryotic-like serine/threonine-protein kinase